MGLTGKQKAAMLLVSLDSSTAVGLLKGLSPGAVEQISIEIARLEASGQGDVKEAAKVAEEFVQTLQQGQGSSTINSFVNTTLAAVVDKNKAAEIETKMRQATARSDPFGPIRSAKQEDLSLALQGEHPQTIAVVLSELDTKKSQEILSHLDEDIRRNVVCRMAVLDSVGSGVRERIAATVKGRLRALSGESVSAKVGGREVSLRKLAVMLSGIEKEIRDGLLEEIKKQDEETCVTVKNLMVTWADILVIADRSLQEILRNIDAKVLAVALHGASEDIAKKIRSNISERAGASVDEEASLMQEPVKKEITQAREEIVQVLREANEEDKLRFLDR